MDPTPNESDTVVTLREITEATVNAVCRIKVSPAQERFVASNAISLAQALFSKIAWYRAIYAGETIVGFVMLEDNVEKQSYYLWRYMIGEEYQGKGYGRLALRQVIDYVRTRPGATSMLLSYVPGEGSPRDFYARLGFVDTGEVDEGENIMRLSLVP